MFWIFIVCTNFLSSYQNNSRYCCVLLLLPLFMFHGHLWCFTPFLLVSILDILVLLANGQDAVTALTLRVSSIQSTAINVSKFSTKNSCDSWNWNVQTFHANVVQYCYNSSHIGIFKACGNFKIHLYNFKQELFSTDRQIYNQ